MKENKFISKGIRLTRYLYSSQNYHSFNYSYQNNQLILNNTLIIPYQNIPKKEYIEVIKKSV